MDDAYTHTAPSGPERQVGFHVFHGLVPVRDGCYDRERGCLHAVPICPCLSARLWCIYGVPQVHADEARKALQPHEGGRGSTVYV